MENDTPMTTLQMNNTPKINTYKEETIERLTRKMTPINAAKVKAILEKNFKGYPYVGYYKSKIKLFERR